MKNLVTGGAGILAATPARRSLPRGHPAVYDNLSRGHGWAVKWSLLERGDLTDGRGYMALQMKQ